MARIAPLKSLEFALLAPLFAIEGVRFYSLQKGEPGRDAAARQPGLVDLAPALADFADTAAAIEELDLTISVDTAVAHLAGAMGRPVWTLLPYVPDWRWQPDGPRSAWYPTMRLYKQSRRGEWGSVVARVAADLEALSRT
jgi:ADP-heptose:LPS heptosyltransferase